MSDSLSPWILDYLLGIATELGAKLYNVQSYKKGRKVQITEFLTYPPENQEQTAIWARISDKQHLATVKFTTEAVVKFIQHAGTRLTQHKGAIVRISDFKPICSHIPMPQGRMTSEDFVVLECKDVSVIGCSGEGIFGQPKGVEQHPEISEWTKGLAQGGGAGNVLKERKMEKEGKKVNVRVLPPMPTPTPPLPRHSLAAVDKISPVPAPFKRINDTDLASYKARWQFLEKNRLRFSGPRRELTEKSQMQPVEDIRRRSRSGTPISNWGASPMRSTKDILSSSLPAPTPAQRRKVATPSPSFSCALGNETQIKNDTRQSSPARKVPRPRSPEPPITEQTGSGRILVPNSDTSQSQSQSQCQRQNRLLLGGLVNDTTGRLPWMSLEDVIRIVRRTAELRLHNNISD